MKINEEGEEDIFIANENDSCNCFSVVEFCNFFFFGLDLIKIYLYICCVTKERKALQTEMEKKNQLGCV